MFNRICDGIYESDKGVISPEKRREAFDSLKQDLKEDSELGRFLDEVLKKRQEQNESSQAEFAVESSGTQ